MSPPVDPALQWTAMADWIEAEDGTVVCLRPALHPNEILFISDALWPERRNVLAAGQDMLAALRVAEAFIVGSWNAIAPGAMREDGGNSFADECKECGIVRAAIARAEGRS